MSLQSLICRRELLGSELIAEMLALHRQYFMNVTESNFHADLTQKEWVIVLREAHRLVGFSTARRVMLELNGAHHHFLVSGDTIMAAEAWSKSALAGCFGQLMFRYLEETSAPLDWFLMSKGYRTYRFLPVFFRSYIPAHNAAADPTLLTRLHAIASHLYGDHYDPATGIISFDGGKDFLAPEFAQVSAEKRSDPHIAFFLNRNPQYARGDELACLAPINTENLQRVAWREIRRVRVQWHE